MPNTLLLQYFCVLIGLIYLQMESKKKKKKTFKKGRVQKGHAAGGIRLFLAFPIHPKKIKKINKNTDYVKGYYDKRLQYNCT